VSERKMKLLLVKTKFLLFWQKSWGLNWPYSEAIPRLTEVS
jgi:hypothetical protein